MKKNTPLPSSYWALTDRLLAGEYPGSSDDREARTKLRALLEAGVGLFLDLTREQDGLRPYAAALKEEAAILGRSAEYRRMPIRDISVPTPAEMAAILDTIDAALSAGRIPYVHCWGGIGRTGTVVGCYLVRNGLSGPEALAELTHLRRDTSKAHIESPETGEQRQMVLDWAKTDRRRR